VFCGHYVAATEEKKPEEKKKSPSPQKGAAPEFVEKFSDAVSNYYITKSFSFFFFFKIF